MIRYDEKLNQEINRIITNYNNKINRLSKKGELNIPEKIYKKDIDDIKKYNKSRIELRRELRQFERFSKRGGEKLVNVNGINIPKYQYETIRELRRVSRRRYNKQIKLLETTKKRGTNYTISQMESVELRNLKAKLNFLDKDYSEITNVKNYIDTLFKNRRVNDPTLFLEKYKIMLKENYDVYGFDESIFNEIAQFLDTLRGNKFYELYQSSSLMKEVLYAYGFIKDIKDEDERKAYQKKFLINIEALKDEIRSLV